MGVKVRPADNGYYVRIDWKGQRKSKFFADKKTAEEFARKLEARLNWASVNGEALVLSQPDQTMPTVGAYLTDWLETYAKVHCKPSTYEGYKRAVEQVLIPAFGSRPLHLLKRDDIKRLVAKLAAENKSRGTIQNALVPLKAAYNHAIEDGLVTFNPVARLGRLLPGREDRKRHIQPLSRDEVKTILRVAQDRYPHLSLVLLCAVRTGLRMGEVIGLQWSDVDFHGGFIEVRRGIVRREVTTTKNHKIRRVHLSPQLQAELQRMKEIRQLEAMDEGQEMAPWVFLSPGKRRWDDRNLRRAWYRVLRAAGIRKVRFHDLRHTFASLLIEQGAHPKYIQDLMGHSGIQVTMDVYGHLFPNGNREWVGKLDEEGWDAKPATQPQVASAPLEQRADKSLNLFGGGDPDRTGDPRLMSPLLYQLSYTATDQGSP